jgi:hypothetical protein
MTASTLMECIIDACRTFKIQALGKSLINTQVRLKKIPPIVHSHNWGIPKQIQKGIVRALPIPLRP